MFIDEARIQVRGGTGGHGAVAFRREKYVPKGGPAGGSGGRGGHVIFIADPALTTLLDFTYQQHYRADHGQSGAGTQKHGRDADDLLVRVPLGTVVAKVGQTEPMADLSLPGQRLIVARGGRGGRGNSVFATSRRQAPRFAERGEPGEEFDIRLELKLLADVGLVGFPNVGKSTLIAACSAARPKIADYPFTTLVPNLGVVRVGERSFVMADVPGLIEGAHEGQGLGDRFLRHLERTRALIHIVDVSGTTGRDPIDEYRIIRSELLAYNAVLGQLPELIALSKLDLPGADEIADRVQPILEDEGHVVFRISAPTHQGLDPLLYAVVDRLDLHPLPAGPVLPDEPITLHGEAPNEYRFEIKREFDGAYRIDGAGVERRVAMTDMNSEEGVRRLHRQLSQLGVIKALRLAGVIEGATVRVGGHELDFVDDNAEWVR